VSNNNGPGGFLRDINFIFPLEQHIERVLDFNFGAEQNGQTMVIYPINTLECK